MHSQLYTILPLALSAVSVYGLPQAASNSTSAPVPARPPPATVVSESPQPTSSSSAATCPDKAKGGSVPVSDLLNINAKLDAAGATGAQCCALYESPDGVKPLSFCASNDAGTTGVYVQVSQQAFPATTNPTNYQFCVSAAQAANYVVDWTSPTFNGGCLNGSNVFNPVQDVWQVPGLTLLAQSTSH